MTTKILRNPSVSVLVLLALTQLLVAGTSDGILSFGKTSLGGGIITFDAPGAGTLPLQGTLPRAINSGETIVGDYFDASFVNHSFLRDPDGTFSTFDPPGAVASGAWSINPAGAIAGPCRDASNVHHGYLRVPNGNHHYVRCSECGHRPQPRHVSHSD